ncbi:dihydrodipicolinate synthase family protein [Chitinophaga lutea]
MKQTFSGLWPALFTPVDESGEPVMDQLEKLVELLIGQKMDGLYILGSTGQGVLFSEQQRKQVAEVVCRLAAGRVPVMVQVGALTTAESVRLAEHAEKCGASGISSVGPIYYHNTAEMALEHYSVIARATALPFFPYQLGDHSMPGNTLEFVRRLLDIPHVTGMKLTTNQLLDISMIHNYAGERLKLFSGSDELFCHASLCGTVGAIGSTYNLWGVECRQVQTAFMQGDYRLAKSFMLEFQKTIQRIMPHIWTFLRQAMQWRYGIDIGPTKAPLANTQQPWKESEVRELTQQIIDMAGALPQTKTQNINA